MYVDRVGPPASRPSTQHAYAELFWKYKSERACKI